MYTVQTSEAGESALQTLEEPTCKPAPEHLLRQQK
jgi:hypothetical protein